MSNFLRNAITSLYNTVSAPVAATHAALATRLNTVKDGVSLLYQNLKKKFGFDDGQNSLKKIVENEAMKEHLPDDIGEADTIENVDLTPQLTPDKYRKAFNGSFKRFRSHGLPKTDVDTYIKKVKPYIKTLFEKQLEELGSAKIQLTMWIKWKKQVLSEPLIELSEEEQKDVKDLNVDHADDNWIYIEKPFNSLMTEVFQGSDLDNILHTMFSSYQDPNGKPSTSSEWFYNRSYYAFRYRFSQVGLDTR